MAFGAGAIGQLAFSETTDDGFSIIVTPTGVQATFALGTATVTPNTIVIPTGVQATFAVGSPTVTGTATVIPTGVYITSALGSATVTGTAVVIPTGVSSTFSVGSVTLESRYFPTGVQATFGNGDWNGYCYSNRSAGVFCSGRFKINNLERSGRLLYKYLDGSSNRIRYGRFDNIKFRSSGHWR